MFNFFKLHAYVQWSIKAAFPFRHKKNCLSLDELCFGVKILMKVVVFYASANVESPFICNVRPIT